MINLMIKEHCKVEGKSCGLHRRLAYNEEHKTCFYRNRRRGDAFERRVR